MPAVTTTPDASAKAFGTLVYRVLENMQQSTSDVATSPHAHRARHALIDNIQDLHSEEFHFTQATGSFQTDSGVWEYDPSDKLSKVVRRVQRLWYSESSEDDILYPANEEGLPQRDHDVVFEDATQDTTTYDSIHSWSWFGRKLYVTPRPDGTIYLVCRYVVQPKVFAYNNIAGSWVYYKDTGGGATAFNAATDLDAERDETGWLHHASQLLVARACRDLYLGPYQAKDPKHTMAQTWIAQVASEEARLLRNERLGQGRKRLRPYFIPGD